MFRKLCSIVLVLSALVPAAQAADFKAGGVYYNFVGTGTKKKVIVTYDDLQNGSYSGKVEIPAEVMYQLQPYPVAGIGDHAFFNCQELTSVTIPEGVTYIDQQAFSHCYSLGNVAFPSTLQRIEDFAFEYCEGLTEVVLPKSLTRIGECAFQICNNLKEFTVEEGNPRFKSEAGVVYSSDGTSLIAYPEAKADEEYTLPADVKRVVSSAFSTNRNLRRVNVGADVALIPVMTFCDCESLEEINVDPANAAMASDEGVLYNKAMTVLLQFPCCNRADFYEVPEGVTDIEDLSMVCARSLTYLTLPSTLQRIGYLAFAGTSGLAEITCRAQRPPEGAYGVDIFEPAVYSGATLSVPSLALDTYKKNSQWGRFSWIEAMVDAAIGELPAADASAPASRCDLLGRPVSDSHRGLTIICRPGSPARKTLGR